MGGYFTDGNVSVELGEHVFLTPVVRRSNAILSPHELPAALLDSGGGVIELSVTGQRLRHDLGDAEAYAVGLFRALALSGPGELGAEDDLGNRAVFAGCLCMEAEARVRAMRLVDMRFVFLAPQRASQPEWSGVPEPPGQYPGTGSLQDYAAGGTALGAHPLDAHVEMARRCVMREIPRARGARPVPAHSGATIAFVVQAHTSATGTHLAAHLAELARSIGPRPVTLTGNGNAFEAALLQGVRPVHTDRHHTHLEARFLLPVTGPTSTTTLEPTTTAAACPDQAHCASECADYYYCDDFEGILCGSPGACSGPVTWVRDGSDACRWPMYSPAGCCSASPLECADGAWSFTLTHNVAGQTAVYSMPNSTGGCPAGVYSRVGGTCSSAPQTVTVYS